ncbi:MAG: SDR family oxidoreductase [Saprospiraceae bacterium]|nr:SDR family oxidoreductase [Saprospiraceae bacterium]
MKGKVVLITGASRGIGSETAFLFAQEGANVIVNYRSREDKAKEVLNGMAPGDHTMIKADMADPQALNHMVEKVIRKYKKVDVLVNNAGIFVPHPIDEVDFDTWQKAWKNTLEVNLIGIANLSYLVAQHMIRNKSGRIINVSSRGAFRGEPECIAYGASKGGLNSLSQSMAKALGKYNISVTAVAPGFVETEMAIPTLESDKGDFIKNESPMGRVASPVEVAHTIIFLAKEESKFLTGGIVDINGASFLRM